jgi:predicted aspartyl protease
MSLLTAILFLGVTQKPVEVPFRAGEESLIVDATVNGKPVSLMFDTGFGGAVDVSNTINVGEPTGTMTLRDFVGEMEAETVKIKSLKLGSKLIDSTGMEAILTPPEDYSFIYGMHCDGIMGLEVIKNNITEINFEHQKFIFYPPTFDISTRTPDNKKTFLTKMLPLGANSAVMTVKAPNGQPLHMALDTGNAFYATSHRDSLERVGLWEAGKDPKYTTMAGVASGPVVSWDKKMSNMTIFGVPVPSSTWDIIDLPSSSADLDGTVGFGFLKNFNIIIDYGRRRIWLENWTGKVENDPPGELGVSAIYDNLSRKVRVYAVSPGSPGDDAGIKKGDELLSIDSVDLGGVISLKKLRKMLAGPVGSKVNLAISHNGNLKRYDLTRKPLVNE